MLWSRLKSVLEKLAVLYIFLSWVQEWRKMFSFFCKFFCISHMAAHYYVTPNKGRKFRRQMFNARLLVCRSGIILPSIFTRIQNQSFMQIHCLPRIEGMVRTSVDFEIHSGRYYILELCKQSHIQNWNMLEEFTSLLQELYCKYSILDRTFFQTPKSCTLEVYWGHVKVTVTISAICKQLKK